MRPTSDQVRDYLVGRLNVELKPLKPIVIEGRIKSEESIYQKLQTGQYSKLSDLDDLVGLKVVMLRRGQVQQAITIVSNILTVVRSEERMLHPSQFTYRQPHLIVRLPDEYLARNPAVRDVRAEVQFTTALQHALDMATHDFDYKGKSFSWGNFRLVAQLRGSLELMDNILDNIESSALLAEQGVQAPLDFQQGQAALDVIIDKLASDILPEDLRRMAGTTASWLEAANMSPSDLASAIDRHPDLFSSLSLDPLDALLGTLLRESGAALLSGYDGRFCVSHELETACQEAKAVPDEKRVRLE